MFIYFIPSAPVIKGPAMFDGLDVRRGCGLDCQASPWPGDGETWCIDSVKAMVSGDFEFKQIHWMMCQDWKSMEITYELSYIDD